MTDELKPCPFCGGEAEWRSGGPGCAWVSCKDCPVETGDGNVPRIAAAWNRRTPDLIPRADANPSGVEALVALRAEREPFQNRVRPWMLACFGEEVSNDKLERGDRLLEEVLELLQSAQYPKERVAALVGYVWSRPEGEPSQEVGGVMVTLAAYCLAHGIDMHSAAETELARIWTKVEKIRAKQAAKPKGSALPQAWPAERDDALAPADALAEVQRLRARVTSLSSQVDTIAEQRDAALAEVQRLREELAERHALHLEQVRITSEWIAERDAALGRVEKLRDTIRRAANRFDWCATQLDDKAMIQTTIWADEARAALDEDARHG